jgi:hypothetical protein
MVNKFGFDKSKIAGIVSDEGSPLIRLFKQVTNKSLGIGNDTGDDLLSFIYAEDEEKTFHFVFAFFRLTQCW